MFFYIMKFCIFFSVYKKCRQNIIKKTKEMLQKKARESYQNLSEEEKTKSIRCRNLFIENKPSQEDKKQKAPIFSQMI